MKKICFLIVVSLLIDRESIAQSIGISNDGSVPHSSAMLDIKSSSKGVLIPRIALTGSDDIGSIVSPQVSLLIYNTAAAGSGATAVEPGFYYWDGSAWAKLGGTPAANLWNTTGNAGTTPGTHFIGTTDNKSLVFKVNNELSGHIDIVNINTFFGYRAGKSITSGWGSIGIGQNALANTTSGFDNIAIGEGTLGANTTGVGNIAIGKFALLNSVTASYNMALGHSALTLVTTGTENTAVGYASLHANVEGSGNTGLGYYSLTNNTGSSNTALGRTSLYGTTTGIENTAAGRASLANNTTGSQNTAIGRSALFNNVTGSRNTALGFEAEVAANNLNNATAIGAKSYANCSDCIVLGSINGVNGATADVNVGIGINNPSHPLSFKSALGGKISFWNGGGSAHYGIGVQASLMQVYTDNVAADIGFGYGNSSSFTERMRIKGNGNVGIGSTNPTNMLEIMGNSDIAKAHIRIHEMQDDFARLRLSSAVNAAYWDVAAKNSVTANTAYMNFYYSPFGGLNVLSLQGDGNAVLAGTLTQNSDLRLKKDLQPIDGALDKILQVSGYNYYWKSDKKDQRLQTGVIAQEVQKVLPELVSTAEDGTLSVNYSGLIPILIQAMKEQQSQIDYLKKQNQELLKLKAEIKH